MRHRLALRGVERSQKVHGPPSTISAGDALGKRLEAKRLPPKVTEIPREYPALGTLFPLDRRWRFARDIIDDPRDTRHLAGHTAGNDFEHLFRQPGPVRGHTILARNRPAPER